MGSTLTDMRWAEELLGRIGLQPTGGQPLHQYAVSADAFAALEAGLTSHIAAGVPPDKVAAVFVAWAAEHVRARFQGGPLTWKFVLEPLGLPPEDQATGRRLTETGLRWWGRSIRQSRAGVRLYLYSLMAEGGIPEALLANVGLYRSVVMGVVGDLEAEGGSNAEAWADRIAARWVERLPQTFRTAEIQGLLADLRKGTAGNSGVAVLRREQLPGGPWKDRSPSQPSVMATTRAKPSSSPVCRPRSRRRDYGAPPIRAWAPMRNAWLRTPGGVTPAAPAFAVKRHAGPGARRA